MFTTQSVEAVPLTNWLSGGISYVFSFYSALALMIGTLLLVGCATAGRPDTQADSSTSTVISDAQRGETTPKATEESRPSTGKCVVVGALIGGAIGIAMSAPICAGPLSEVSCPLAITVIVGMATLGGAMGAIICNE